MSTFVFDSLTLAHQTPYRLRLRYRSTSSFDVSDLERYIALMDWVKEVRINTKAHSIAIAYTALEADDIIRRLSVLRIDEIHTNHSNGDNEGETLLPLAAPLLALGTIPLLPESLKLPVSLLATYKNILKGGEFLMHEGITSEVLESLAIAISLYRKDYFAAATTNFLLEFGEHIEDTIARKSDSMLQSLLVPDIKDVWIERDQQEIQIPFDQLKIGDIVIVNSGDTVPVDGTVIGGDALIDEASMTGEAVPVKKMRGDRATSGTQVVEGRIRIWAEQVGEQSATYKIASMINESLNSKSSTQIEAAKLANKLVPVTLGLAGFAYLTTGDLERVAAVFQADYSCALKLATPVAFKSSMYEAGKHGALIKSADVLEKIAEADTVVFDKTGTLSTGKLMVRDIYSLDPDWSKNEILSLAASIEEHYFHPIAEAVVNAAKSCDMCQHFHHSEVEFIVAHGVCALVEEKKVVIGSRHYLEEDEGIPFILSESMIDDELHKGSTLLYIGYDGKLLGVIALFDEARHNAKSTIEYLKTLGITQTVMLTGDHTIKAQSMAQEIGIDRFHAELLPEDKLRIVKELKAEGKKVMFVGDGINDAPALAESSVGIAMQRGADIARVSADVVLLEDDIAVVADIKDLANKTIKKVRTNYHATIWVNSAILLLATMGKLSPVATSVLHNGTTIGVLAYAMKRVQTSTNLK